MKIKFIEWKRGQPGCVFYLFTKFKLLSDAELINSGHDSEADKPGGTGITPTFTQFL